MLLELVSRGLKFSVVNSCYAKNNYADNPKAHKVKHQNSSTNLFLMLKAEFLMLHGITNIKNLALSIQH